MDGWDGARCGEGRGGEILTLQASQIQVLFRFHKTLLPVRFKKIYSKCLLYVYN